MTSFCSFAPATAALAAHLSSGLVPPGVSNGGGTWLENLLHADAVGMWMGIGLAAQAAVAIALMVFWSPTSPKRPRRFATLAGTSAVVASLALLVYALGRGDVVFVVGQGINTLVIARIALLARRGPRHGTNARGRSFPVVAPDSAERRLDSIR